MPQQTVRTFVVPDVLVSTERNIVNRSGKRAGGMPGTLETNLYLIGAGRVSINRESDRFPSRDARRRKDEASPALSRNSPQKGTSGERPER